MSYLTTKEKLEIILEMCEKHGITAYDIGENTPLNTSGIHRILTGEVTNPRASTVNTIYEYIEEKLLAKNFNKSHKITDRTQEPQENYTAQIPTVQKIVAQEVYNILKPYLKNFSSSHNQINSSLLKIMLDIEKLNIKQEETNEKLESITEVVIPKK